jgi:hypothetical protein
MSKGGCVKYQMILRLLDDDGNECGAVSGDAVPSVNAAAKSVIREFDEVRDDAGRVKKPVDLSDELKGAARRFGA